MSAGSDTVERPPLAAVPGADDEFRETEPGAPEDAPEGKAETPEPKPLPPMQIPIPGTSRELTDVAGGAQPTVTEVRLLGGSMKLEGQFEGEEIVQILVTAKVGAVEVVYTSDDYGKTKVVKRRHKLTMIDVDRVGTK